MTREIALTRGLVAIVDAEDYERVCNVRWYPQIRSPEHIYARTKIGGKTVMMHRVVTNAPPGAHVDHINRNCLDNRKVNLRVCTPWQNSSYCVHRRAPKYGYRGIMRGRNGFRANISHCGWRVFGKYHSTAIEAAQDYDLLALKLKAEFAVLNFPHEARL